MKIRSMLMLAMATALSLPLANLAHADATPTSPVPSSSNPTTPGDRGANPNALAIYNSAEDVLRGGGISVPGQTDLQHAPAGWL